MTILNISPLDTTSLYCMTTTTNSVIEDENHASTTALGIASTITASSAEINTSAYYSDKYISSLSDEQLDKYTQLVTLKENEIDLFGEKIKICTSPIENGEPKVLIKK